jgi:hypothetical protein
MAESTARKGGKNMTTSATRKARYAEYTNHKTRDRHKIKRVLKSSGRAAAELYARTRGLLGFLADLAKG